MTARYQLTKLGGNIRNRSAGPSDEIAEPDPSRRPSRHPEFELAANFFSCVAHNLAGSELAPSHD